MIWRAESRSRLIGWDRIGAVTGKRRSSQPVPSTPTSSRTEVHMPDANTEDFAAEAERYVDELKTGVPIAKAIESVNDVVHHPDVVAAGVAMLASDGSIDMKRLATDAGISRASLYRYYPDKG